jgi:hypothetical protein
LKSRKSADIIPTKDETREILAQIFQAQTHQITQGTWKPENIQNAPIILTQAWLGRMLLKTINQIDDEYFKSFEQFKMEVKKAVEEFDNKVNSIFREYD